MMRLIKKVLLRLFLWSWVLTLPITLVGGYLTLKVWDSFETFHLRYDSAPHVSTISIDAIYEASALWLKIQTAVHRYVNNSTQLEPVYLYASQADLSELQTNLPHSGFSYIKARLMKEDGTGLLKAKIRYRGDSFYHWGREKKSFRVKTSKKKLYKGMRSFNLLAPKFVYQLNNYLAFQLAERLGLITPKTQLVRLYLNNEDRGTHLLVEQLKEMTLRRHHLMPADIYRGEMVNKDRFTDSQVENLFQSASVWDKVAVNNHYSADSKKPLVYLLSLIQNQDNPKAQAELSRILDLSAWARFSVFETLIQSRHYDKLHNWRLYYDPWRQKFLPIVWDPVGWFGAWLEMRNIASSEIKLTDFHRALFKNGDFLRLRNKVLQDFFNTEDAQAFLDFVAETRQIMHREVQTDPLLNVPDIEGVRHRMKTMEASIQQLFTQLKKDNLAPAQKVLYRFQPNQLNLYLQDPRPLLAIRLDFDQALSTKPKVLLHYHEQAQPVTQDISNQLSQTGNQLEIKLNLLADFSLQFEKFTFLKQSKNKLILGNVIFELSKLENDISLLSVMVDYGDGWELAQQIDKKQLLTLNLEQMKQLYSGTRSKIKNNFWQIFWHSGQGFHAKDSIDLKGIIDQSGLWKKTVNLPSQVKMLRVDLPENRSLRLSQLNLHINGKTFAVPKSKLRFNALQLQELSVVTNRLKDPYFVIDMRSFLSNNSLEEKITVEVSFQVEEVSWKASFMESLPSINHVFRPIPEQKPSNPLIWKGDILIEGVKTITRPLVIHPGSRLLFAKNATLVIKNRLLAIGTKQKPIQFIAKDESSTPWGAVVLFGSEANDSIISHCLFAEGSGLKEDLFEYTAMLSLHNVQQVYISDCEFRDNKRVDDMVHVVYSDVKIERCVFNRAFSDALDIDISTATIVDSRFIDSGNDAIDLMTSIVSVADSILQGNGDKGISVGEDSHLFAVNNKLKDNKIAIQAKDASVALLFNQTFQNNQTALHTYKKNWRYGSGGTILAAKSVFESNQKDLQAKKRSNIYIFDSYSNSDLSKKRIHALGVDAKQRQKAVKNMYLPQQFSNRAFVQHALQQADPKLLLRRNMKTRGSDFAGN